MRRIIREAINEQAAVNTVQKVPAVIVATINGNPGKLMPGIKASMPVRDTTGNYEVALTGPRAALEDWCDANPDADCWVEELPAVLDVDLMDASSMPKGIFVISNGRGMSYDLVSYNPAALEPFMYEDY